MKTPLSARKQAFYTRTLFTIRKHVNIIYKEFQTKIYSFQNILPAMQLGNNVKYISISATRCCGICNTIKFFNDIRCFRILNREINVLYPSNIYKLQLHSNTHVFNKLNSYTAPNALYFMQVALTLE